MSQEAECIFDIIFSFKPHFQKSRDSPKMIKIFPILLSPIFTMDTFGEKTQYEIDMQHLCDISAQKNFLDILNRGSALTELRKLLTEKDRSGKFAEEKEIDFKYSKNIQSAFKTLKKHFLTHPQSLCPLSGHCSANHLWRLSHGSAYARIIRLCQAN